jgi:hypothetical protein
MPETERKEHTPIGTASYDNWRAHIAGDPVLGESEHLMYSDALLTGSIPTGLGPYSLLNLVPLDEGAGIVRPVFVLRLSVHLEFSLPQFDKTEASRYHGGSPIDRDCRACFSKVRSPLSRREPDEIVPSRGRPEGSTSELGLKFRAHYVLRNQTSDSP